MNNLFNKFNIEHFSFRLLQRAQTLYYGYSNEILLKLGEFSALAEIFAQIY